METLLQAYIIKDLDKFRRTEGVISAEMISRKQDGTIWVTALISHPKGRIYGDNVVHFEGGDKPIGPSRKRDIQNLI